MEKENSYYFWYYVIAFFVAGLLFGTGLFIALNLRFENYYVKSPVPICPCGGIYPKGMRIGQLPVTNIYNAY